MGIIDLEAFEKAAASCSSGFAEATPFPHIVVDDLVDAPHDLLEFFPDPSWEGWGGLGDSYQIGKLSCDEIESIPEPFKGMIYEMSTPRFLRALERLTGIQKLLPDPYLAGGGLHMSGSGGTLAPHTDFHIYDKADLYRRINLILYLCPDWTEDDGGCLQLYDSAGTSRRTVVPAWGRAVVFRTDDRSIHGFPTAVAEQKIRRSIALYYYTAAEAPEFSGDATTYWRVHGDHRGAVRKARLWLFQLLLQVSRAFSLAAHLVNPNQGIGWWRNRQARASKKV